MGIAALNINGYTINRVLDVPLEVNEHTGSTQNNCDTGRLHPFKQKYYIMVIISAKIMMKF